VVAAALGGSTIRRGQQRVHLRFVQIGDDCLAGLLERDGANLATPGNVLGTVLSHEARQRMNCGQPLVAGGNRTLPCLFQIGQEETHQIRRYIDHLKPIHRLVQLGGSVRNQQRKGIAVTALRVARQIALGNKVFEQKTPYPGSQQGLVIHAVPPAHSAQSAGWLRAATPASR
jgi:hypothetical protein